jgi:hypothetical protein
LALPFPIGDCPERVIELTTHLHLVPGLRMSGAVVAVPHTPSWCDAQLISPVTFLEEEFSNNDTTLSTFSGVKCF